MQELLRLSRVSKSYGSIPALQDVSLTLPRGKIIGLLGPNGSGKTTLIKLVAGLLFPGTGEISVDGCPPGCEAKRKISYLPERNALDLGMSVEEAVAYFAEFFPDFDPVLAHKMLSQLSVPPERRIRTLSKGTKEKVQLILAMSRRTSLYLFDEPIGGVDHATRDYVLHMIKENLPDGATVLISTHLIADVEPILDEFLFLFNGRVVRYDSADDARAEEGKSLDAIFREAFRC